MGRALRLPLKPLMRRCVGIGTITIIEPERERDAVDVSLLK